MSTVYDSPFTFLFSKSKSEIQAIIIIMCIYTLSLGYRQSTCCKCVTLSRVQYSPAKLIDSQYRMTSRAMTTAIDDDEDSVSRRKVSDLRNYISLIHIR